MFPPLRSAFDNVLVTSGGVVKIVDFGLAKLAGRTMQTKAGSTLGTAGYMSREQARGEPADRRTDISSLGVVLFEMLSGKRPFDAEYENALLYAILNAEPEPPFCAGPSAMLLLGRERRARRANRKMRN